MIVAKFGNYERTLRLGDPPSAFAHLPINYPEFNYVKKASRLSALASVRRNYAVASARGFCAIPRYLASVASHKVHFMYIHTHTDIYIVPIERVPERDESAGSRPGSFTNLARFAFAI